MKTLYIYNFDNEKIGYFSIETDLKGEHLYRIIRQFWLHSRGSVADILVVPDCWSRVYMSQENSILFERILSATDCKCVKLTLYIE